MSRLTVAPSRDYLLKDGKPFFYLADTAWNAFPNLPVKEWQRYLAYRKMQGFTALQISILPITHDTSLSPQNLDPFVKDAQGKWDFAQYNEAYFEKAETMVEMAVQEGFVPVLGLLWCNYVPGTRCAELSPVASALPREIVVPYATEMAQRFKKFDPIFFISGDTNFESPHEEPYYMAALDAVRIVCPDSLITMHLNTVADLLPSFIDKVDFYMYQSGHTIERQNLPYLNAQKFAAYPVKRPVINSEPCYEGHARSRGALRTRHNAFNVRKAVWQSLLSGAKAGVAYGAQGIWSFHRDDMTFLGAERSFPPFEWEVALTLEGGWDVAFARWLYETYNLFEVDPANLVLNEDAEIRASANESRTKVAVYTPYAFDVDLDLDLAGFRCHHVDLETRRVTVPEVQAGAKSRVRKHRFNSDALFLAVKD